MIRKLILLILTIIVFSCGKQDSTPKSKINEEVKQKIEAELKEINDNMSETEIDNMMTVAKMNYSKNAEVGIMYFEKLAKYRPEALNYLSEYYYNIKDYENYEKWEKQAIEKTDNPDVIYNLAHYFDQISQKNEEAIKYYLMAVEKGHEPSKHNLALLYGRLGRYDEATKLFHEIGLTEGDGMYYTGMYYKTKKDYKKAEEIYNEMIAKGNPDGYFGLGQMYEDKFKNKKKALEFYEKGAELNEAKSAFKAGYMNSKKFNTEKAIKYYLIAANQGDTIAMYNLGLNYASELEYEEAKKWYKKAAELGHENAKKELMEIDEKIKKLNELRGM